MSHVFYGPEHELKSLLTLANFKIRSALVITLKPDIYLLINYAICLL